MTDTKQPSTSWLVFKALAKASLGLLNPKIWLLSLLPLALAGALWTGIAMLAWEPANDMLRAAIGGVTMPTWFPDWIPSRTLWIPLIVLIATVPMVIITTLVLVGVFGTGITARRVGAAYGLLPLASTGFARSATVLASVWHSSWVLTVLIVLWLLALVLYPVLGVGVLVQMMVLAWANARLFSRDVLAEFTSSQERDALLKQHRGALWGLGLIASVPATIPSFMWLGGAAATIALPVMALFAVWLYVMIFLATSLLFSHYLLPALKTLRDQATLQQAALDAKLRSEQAQLDANSIETSATEAPALNAPNIAPPALPAPTLPAPSL